MTAALVAIGCTTLLVGGAVGSPAATADTGRQAPVRINAGGPAGTFEGERYLADTYAVGGWARWADDEVTGTSSSELYQARRIAPDGYSIPVADGTYDVTLRTAETWWDDSGKRLFSATVEGRSMLDDVDLHAVAGHDRAHSATSRVTVTDGRVDLDFSADEDHAVVAGIEVVPVGGAQAPPAPVVPAAAQPRPGGGGTSAGAASSKPGAGNTGVPAGTALKRHEGDLTVTTAGAVVDSLDIHGFLVIKAPNVTVRRSIVRGAPITSATATGLVTVTASGARNFLIEDSELVAAHPSPWLDGIKGGNFTMRRVEVRGTVDGVGIHLPNTRIESSWVHGLKHYPDSPTHRDGSHNDAIQVHGGNNIRIVGNRLEEAHNAAVMMTQDYSKTYDVQIRDNWMDHGGCTVNIHDKGSTMAGISVSGNRFGRSTRNPDCAIIHSSRVQLTASGNVWDDNGKPVRVRNG